jgi:hypothetical protein
MTKFVIYYCVIERLLKAFEMVKNLSVYRIIFLPSQMERQPNAGRKAMIEGLKSSERHLLISTGRPEHRGSEFFRELIVEIPISSKPGKFIVGRDPEQCDVATSGPARKNLRQSAMAAESCLRHDHVSDTAWRSVSFQFKRRATGLVDQAYHQHRELLLYLDQKKQTASAKQAINSWF